MDEMHFATRDWPMQRRPTYMMRDMRQDMRMMQRAQGMPLNFPMHQRYNPMLAMLMHPSAIMQYLLQQSQYSG